MPEAIGFPESESLFATYPLSNPHSSPMSGRHLILAASILVVLAAALGLTARSTAPEGVDTASTTRTPSAVPLRDSNREADRIDSSQVIRMGPRDWEQLFRERYTELGEENRRDILELASELDHALSTGGKPSDPDAEVYAEAILTLLEIPEDSSLAGAD